MITSPQNESLKQIRKLARRRERDRTGLFVAEGEDLIEAAGSAGWEPVARYAAAGSAPAGADWIAVEPALLASVSALGSGTRAIGVYRQRSAEPQGPLCVYLHGVSDPGNVGTIVRSAAAFGASSVALGLDCADPFGPKAVRASMGAIFSVPIARGVAVEAVPGERLALLSEGGNPLAGPCTHDTTILVGAEREGLPEEVVALCDRTVTIPIAIDSLNAAMAATVALYELTRGLDSGKHRMAAQ
jgi:TrmH family RNA methyltransferase